MPACPSQATLGKLAVGSNDEPGFAAVEAHVESCRGCQEVLERLAVGSSTSGDRRPGRLPPPEQPPAIPGFVIEHRLGRGGMGVVYQAWQPRLGRRVAIKVVGGGAGIGAEDRRRWLREARAIGGVRHRNIVQIYDAGEQDGCLYLVLELIPGGSLAERLNGPVPATVAAGLMATVSRAVEHLHRAGIVHLDIKPSNILLDGAADGRLDQATPMVTDFGIALAGDDPAAPHVGPFGVGGTPSFMAPEQIDGDLAAIGPRCDVFALGANLYTLLTGRPPFQGASTSETLDLVRTSEPASPRTLVPGLPRDLETIALTCLSKDPRHRYASAGALADDLGRWLDGFPIQARPVSALARAGRWCRRRPTLALLLAALAMTVASSLVGLLALCRHSEAERVRAEEALVRALRSEQATSGAIGELVGLLSTTVDSPQLLASERLEHSARVVLELTATLRRDRVFAPSNLVGICELERGLAVELRRLGRYAEARKLLIDNQRLLEGRMAEVFDPNVDRAYALSLMEFVTLAESENHTDEELDVLLHAEAKLSRLAHDPGRPDSIINLDLLRLRMASILAGRGQDEARRALLETHIGMLERLAGRDGADPSIALLAALARSTLSAEGVTDAKLRAALARFPSDRPLPFRFERRVADWIAADVDPFPAGSGPVPIRGDRDDPQARAASIIKALESRIVALGMHPSLFPLTASGVANMAATRGAEQRKAGDLDGARRTAATLLALARALVRSDPDETVFHHLLCQAFVQESKNAWKVNDHDAIEAALRQALAEARLALQLDPANMAARTTASVLQDKLARLETDPPPPGQAPPPTSSSPGR